MPSLLNSVGELGGGDGGGGVSPPPPPLGKSLLGVFAGGHDGGVGDGSLAIVEKKSVINAALFTEALGGTERRGGGVP